LSANAREPKNSGLSNFSLSAGYENLFSRQEVAVPNWLRSSSCYGGLLRPCERCDGLQCLALCKEQVQRTGILEAGEPIGAREETGKRREGTVASEPTLSPTSLVLSLPGQGWRGQPSARNHWLRPMSEKPIFSSGPTLGSGSILPRTLLLIGRKIELSSLALGCGPASPAVPSSTVPLLERRQRRTEPAWNIDGTALWLVAKSLLELLRD